MAEWFGGELKDTHDREIFQALSIRDTFPGSEKSLFSHPGKRRFEFIANSLL